MEKKGEREDNMKEEEENKTKPKIHYEKWSEGGRSTHARTHIRTYARMTNDTHINHTYKQEKKNTALKQRYSITKEKEKDKGAISVDAERRGGWGRVGARREGVTH